MKQNKLHQFWPVLIGQFHNPEHELIKEELINFLKNKKKKNLKEINSFKTKIIMEIIIFIKAIMICTTKKTLPCIKY